ncbi:MAG: hypothetical protein VXZ72_02545 [Chlamydiota bacterium]|nr:hypothetical protein [Chlamydiota bacterium]
MKEGQEHAVQRICDALKRETLDPARDEAQAILTEAREEARRLIEEAEAETQRILNRGKEELEKHRRIVLSSFHIACRQGIDSLKEKIERELFRLAAQEIIQRHLGKDQVALLIQAAADGLREGIDRPLGVVVSRALDSEALTAQLGQAVMEKIEGQALQIDDIHGVTLFARDRHLTVEITTEALASLIKKYTKESFCELLFGEGTR